MTDQTGDNKTKTRVFTSLYEVRDTYLPTREFHFEIREGSRDLPYFVPDFLKNEDKDKVEAEKGKK